MELSSDIIIENITEDNILELCLACVSSEKRDDPDWKKGIEEKTLWATDMFKKWGSFAKIAYYKNNLAGMIQYKPIPEEKVVSIDCIYVHEEKYWQKGVGSKLLASLVEDMKKPSKWFGNEPARAIIVQTFPGHSKGQLSAQEFFIKRQFRPVSDNPNFLYYPLQEDFIYQPGERKQTAEYRPKIEDRGRVLIFCGPNNCSAAYPFFLKRMEKHIREIDNTIPIVYIDISREPEEAQARNVGYGDCIVNTKLINAFVLDKEGFQKEVREALKAR